MAGAHKHVLVIGGGISGLSAAFHLEQRLPLRTRISILEARPRLGGWIQSDRLRLESHEGKKGEVVLEAGPRTLRSKDRGLLELINRLHLKDQLVTVSKQAPAAQNRFIYGPPLTLLPSSIVSLLQIPFHEFLRPILPALMAEPLKFRNRPDGIQDESVDSFLTRRFGAEVARRFGSALVHGIYAADSRKLSVRSAFPSLWDAEDSGNGSVILGLGKAAENMAKETAKVSYEVGDHGDLMKNVSVYSFRDGLETLPKALEEHLSKRPNVQILKSTTVLSVYVEDSMFQVRANVPLGDGLPPTHIISTVPFASLPELVPDPGLSFLVSSENYSSVLLLNLVLPSFPHPEGFGYLVPRPENDYQLTEHNPGILGTVFDSVALREQDTLEGITKMTIMAGGPYKTRFGEPYLPEFLSALKEHLGMPIPDPIYHRFVLRKDCIPVPQVCHLTRMAQLRETLLEKPYSGRLEMIGAEVGGVSVADCVRQGREAAERIVEKIKTDER